jgi:hypothetical protein
MASYIFTSEADETIKQHASSTEQQTALPAASRDGAFQINLDYHHLEGSW